MFDKEKYKPESRVSQRGRQGRCVTTFNSLGAFTEYIGSTEPNMIYSDPLNRASGTIGNGRWSGTNTYQEAVDLMKNGYREGTEKLKARLKAQTQDEEKVVRKMVLDAVGFQPVVPNYLMGLPNSMVNTKMVAKKQKVITLNKDISYNAGFTTDEIFEYSARTLRLVQSLEAQGYAINLNVILGIRYEGTDDEEIIKVRVKSANERMNLQKVSFPIAHQSMLRRMLFKYLEVTDTCPMKRYMPGYGTPLTENVLMGVCKKDNEIYLRRVVNEKTDSDIAGLLAK